MYIDCVALVLDWLYRHISFLQIGQKGLSSSARGKREVTILGIDPRKITSEKSQRRRPNYPPWVYVDNYSYV